MLKSACGGRPAVGCSVKPTATPESFLSSPAVGTSQGSIKGTAPGCEQVLQPRGLPKDIHVSFVGTTKSHAIRQEMVAQLQPQVTGGHSIEISHNLLVCACLHESRLAHRQSTASAESVASRNCRLQEHVSGALSWSAAFQGYLFTEAAHNRSFELVERSVFTLAPRGSGSGSFRMYEALQLGSIPIFIWGEH